MVTTIINRTRSIKSKSKKYKRSKKSRLSKRSKKSRFSKKSNNKSRSCLYKSKGGGKLLEVLTTYRKANLNHSMSDQEYGIVRSETFKVLKTHCDLFLEPFRICGTNCNNYLFKKLLKIAHNERIDSEHQETIILQVQNDFMELINNVTERVRRNKALLQEQLGIPESYTLVLVECLGDESHNHGKIALKLVFNKSTHLPFHDSKSIVYKPRSLLAEHVLCNKTNSVFQMENLGTYTTIDLGNYGYQEYLENIEEENTLTRGELVNYMKDIATTEKICKQLRISDLHCENVVTCKKKMFLIDLEVYLVPTEIVTEKETGLMSGDMSGGEFFNDYEGYCSHNQIWLKDKIRPTGVTFENLKEKYEVDFISQDKIKLSQEVMQGINNAKKQLKSTPGRLVVIETRHLKSLINNGDPYKRPEVIILDLTTQFFNENKLFKSHLSENSERIIKAYQEDFLHNDVPIFYYNSINKTITYHDITIGSVKTPLEIFRDNLPLPKMTDLEWSQYVGSMRKRHGVDWLNIIKENMGRRVFGMATPAAAQAAVVVSAPAVSHHDDSHNYMYMDTMEEEEMEVG